ncbi:Probable ATP-dependent helicase dinG homolog [Providencia rustigianii]|uniref:ATP-dependent DNA helicase n=1 Tax=Providencia rustigianii TaxID=158850 RepID=UPI0001BC3E4C|nr:ATP-dependent DNA helicase [Providencia rustigianii]MTC60948.1 ATP-dependent helicase [Providencia rustigianii]SPY77502.1 Probable ATP-dependent helicase dinG homolog [Providencia rustigianii]SUC26892.1 Probable ATP-dependent helicase dinG homolog [Providencia rustigianii]VEB69557.1 Probable ATP-dependent helicase dinG homolog [Providencia rustigianii]VEH55362.1 Probable ATP-dependent helicase dinG homolog [Providencia rustigianii]
MSNDFSADGFLAKTIPGFQPRAAQVTMSEAVSQSIEQQHVLVAEAGTGTGKTYAYLVPALRSGKKVIVSTGSKALQDQLYHRDLPSIIDAMNYQGKTALLKGRSNYLCLERLDQQSLGGGSLEPEILTAVVRLRSWSIESELGDVSTCHDIAEDSPVWPLVTSTNDNCLGSDCPRYQECFVLKARRKALDADIVVVNHHLFMADRVVKDTGFGELIPQADVMIFDEAHQIPDIASQYFGQQLSSRQLLDLARDMVMTYRTELKDQAQLQKSADRLTQSTLDFRLNLGDNSFRGNLRELLKLSEVQRSLTLLDDALELCYEVVKTSLGRSQTLDSIFERVTIYRNRLNRLKDVTIPGYSYWFESYGRHFLLALTPLTVADKFSEMIAGTPASWVFTSATLSVNEKLSHFTDRLGLNSAKTLLLASPFDYETQTLLCVPRFLPEPNQRGSAQKLATMLRPLIEKNKGRCFFLCTSHLMMRELAEEFKASLTLPVLMQGESSKNKLLAQFIAAGNAVLVATSSFWEGVDVRGDELSCVIIDKLPFTAPDDPLLRARIEDCELRGGDPFADVQLPDAVITLKQGVGRLIRDTTDYGVIVICDNRLVTRPYGEVFLRSLPPSPRTRSINKAIEFLEKKRSEHNSED